MTKRYSSLVHFKEALEVFRMTKNKNKRNNIL